MEIQFGDLLRMERERLELSRPALAKRLEVEPAAVGHWERGRNMPRDETLTKMAEVFGPSSPISRLIPKGSVIVGEMSAKEEDHDYATVSMVIREPVAHYSLMERDIQAALPAELRQYCNVEFKTGVHRVEADYLSPQWAMEFKTAGGRANALVIERGLFQLDRLRRLLPRDPPRKFGLLIQGMPASLGSRPLQHAVIDAMLYDIEVATTSTVEEAAKLIQTAEATGTFYP